MDLPTKEELDAEAEINLLNAAQDRADAEQAETQVEALPSDTEYFHIDDQLSALATEQDRSDLTDAERMRQAFPELAARYDAEQGNGAFLPSWLRSLVSGVPSYEELKTELPEDAPGGYRVGTRARDIVTAPYDIVGGFLHPDTGPTLGDVGEVGGDFLAGLTGRDIPTEEVVTTDTESKEPVTALLGGEEVDQDATAGIDPRARALYEALGGDANRDALAARRAAEEVDTPSGRYSIKSTPTGAAPGSASSIQSRYDQLTQPQSGSEAFFDLLKTLGGGGGRSKGYEFGGISERGAELDAARREEAMGIIDAETRQRAIDAQGQTDQRRFVQYYIEANRGAEKSDAQLGVEASQLYLRASNIYAGQTNRMSEYSAQVALILDNIIHPLVKEYTQAVRSEGAQSPAATEAFQAILDQAQRIYEAGTQQVIGT
jgi:hypothetical protein